MERKIYKFKTQEQLRQLIDDHYAHGKHLHEMGKRVAWCVANVDTSIAIAMGYIPFYPENHASLCASRGVSLEHCQIAEAHDYSPDICSYARNDLGAIFAQGGKSPVGGLPKPDLLLTATMCHTHIKWWEDLSRIFQVPLIVIDTPFAHDGLSEEDIARAAAFVRYQLEEEITTLERLTGQHLNYSRLQEVVANTARAAQLYEEFAESARHIPSPVTIFDAFLNLGPLDDYRGFPEAVRYYEQLMAEVRERINQGFSAVGEERFRLYWDGVPVWSRLGWLSRKFISYGACFVTAAYPYAWTSPFAYLDPEQPLESIARSQVLLTDNRGSGWRVDWLSGLLKGFSVDGLVMQLSRTCHLIITDHHAIMKELTTRAGVPAVIIEGDMADPRLFSEAEANSQIESFMEMLAKRKG